MGVAGADSKAVGLGGRQVRSGPEYGHIYDHFSVVYEYADETKKAYDEIVHKVADVDDELAEKFINEEPVSQKELRAAIRRREMPRLPLGRGSGRPTCPARLARVPSGWRAAGPNTEDRTPPRSPR